MLTTSEYFLVFKVLFFIPLKRKTRQQNLHRKMELMWREKQWTPKLTRLQISYDYRIH